MILATGLLTPFHLFYYILSSDPFSLYLFMVVGIYTIGFVCLKLYGTELSPKVAYHGSWIVFFFCTLAITIWRYYSNQAIDESILTLIAAFMVKSSNTSSWILIA